MNRRFTSVLLFALVVSGVASFLVYHLVLSGLQGGRPSSPKHRLLVASHELSVGALIQDADVRWAATADEVPATALNDPKQVVGRGVITTVYTGESFVDGRLAPKGAGAGLAALIPVGMRAVAMKVDQVVGVAGFVVPGMRVDVLVSGTGNANPGQSNLVSKTVLQNIEVLSAGKKIERTTDGKPEDAQVVNLLVTPDQAEVLSLANSEAKVQLVLRNPLDQGQEATHGTSVAAIFGVSPPAVAQPVRTVVRPAAPQVATPEPETVEVFNGAKKSQQSLAQ